MGGGPRIDALNDEGSCETSGETEAGDEEARRVSLDDEDNVAALSTVKGWPQDDVD
jgi:hypothetical protein